MRKTSEDIKEIIVKSKEIMVRLACTLKDRIAKDFSAFQEIYGALGLAALVAVLVKFMIFYHLMGITAGVALVYLVSLIITYLMFKMPEDKLIPAIIFCLLSVLMFCDVTYNSFFYRYLSVGMLGAVEVVGDIGDSIKAIMRPLNFAMLMDAGLVLAAVLKVRGKESAESRVTESDAELKAAVGIYAKKFSALLLIFVLLIGNLTGIGFFRSIANQEFYTFHVKDILSSVFASEKGSLATLTDHYRLEKEGPLFGVAEGKNLVVIQLESFQRFVVDREYNGQEITPNLNKLLEGNTTYFDNFYQQIGSGNTSDAEFAANNGLYGSLTSYTYKLYEDNYFRGLPVMLKERGYNTAVFHSAEDRSFWNREAMYPAQGFDRYYGGLKHKGGDYELREWMGWGPTDSEFMEQTVAFMKEIEEPYYNFIITISNHHPFEMLDKYCFVKLRPEDRNTIVGNYIQSTNYTDYCLGLFFDLLKKEGMYDDTVFVIYGDHLGITSSEETDKSMERLLGRAYDFQDMMGMPLMIHMPDDTHDIRKTISTAGGQTDIFPTLAYLFGLKELDTLYVGHNLYTITNGLVAEQTMMVKGSFFSNEVAYEMSRDGIFANGRAWNIRTGEPVDVESCYEQHLKSIQIIENSEYILKTDAIRKVFLEGQSI